MMKNKSKNLREIDLVGVRIKYILKESKGRNLRMQISPLVDKKGERVAVLLVSKPRFIMQYFVDKYLQSKGVWILEKLELVKSQISKNIENGKDFQNLSQKELNGKYKKDKEVARKLVAEKLEYWQAYYLENFNVEFRWNRVAIKNAQTRWGSCSSKKNLNFSFKIIYLSNAEQDYLIVHELSHLLQMNHSENFWKLVELAIPNYKIVRHKLKGI